MATTTEAIRRAIQNSEASLRALSARYGINQKTVAKWRKRTSVADLPTGPKDAKSTVLTLDEEAIIVAFRRHTLLPPEDCLSSLQPIIPHPKPVVPRENDPPDHFLILGTASLLATVSH